MKITSDSYHFGTYQVYLNGHHVSRCVEVDDVEGYVILSPTDVNGYSILQPNPDPEGKEPLVPMLVRLEGKVNLVHVKSGVDSANEGVDVDGEGCSLRVFMNKSINMWEIMDLTEHGSGDVSILPFAFEEQDAAVDYAQKLAGGVKGL